MALPLNSGNLAVTAQPFAPMTSEEFEEKLHADINKPAKNFRMGYMGSPQNTPKRKIYNGAHRASWANTTVNIQTRKIKIDVFLNFKQNSLTQSEYSKLKNLAIAGINHYWSRKINVNHTRFNVVVNAIHKNSGDAISVDLYIENDSEYARSMNPAILGIDASFIYQQGLLQLRNISTNLIDADFKLVAAHEFGHSVLMYAEGLITSWGHKDSVNVLTQRVKTTAPVFPKKGKADLMKYYNLSENKQIPMDRRVSDTVSMEIDIKRLIWSSTISWLN